MLTESLEGDGLNKIYLQLGGKGVSENSLFYGSIWLVALYRPLGFAETGGIVTAEIFHFLE